MTTCGTDSNHRNFINIAVRDQPSFIIRTINRVHHIAHRFVDIASDVFFGDKILDHIDFTIWVNRQQALAHSVDLGYPNIID